MHDICNMPRIGALIHYSVEITLKRGITVSKQMKKTADYKSINNSEDEYV